MQNPEKDTTEALFFQTAFSLGYTFGGTAAPLPVVETASAPKFDTLKYITQPSAVSPLFLSTAGIDIQGSVPANTTKVVVNDYALQGFTAGGKTFFYKARTELRNLIEGENTYKVQFFQGNALLAEEKLVIFYHPDTQKLASIKAEWTQKNTPQAEPKPVTVPLPDTDPKKLYDKDRAPLVFRIVVQSDIALFQEIAQKLQAKLEDLAVSVEVISLPPADIRKMVIDQTPSYDIVIAGVNL